MLKAEVWTFESIRKDRQQILDPWRLTVRILNVLGELQKGTRCHNRDFQARDVPNSQRQTGWWSCISPGALLQSPSGKKAEHALVQCMLISHLLVWLHHYRHCCTHGGIQCSSLVGRSNRLKVKHYLNLPCNAMTKQLLLFCKLFLKQQKAANAMLRKVRKRFCLG